MKFKGSEYERRCSVLWNIGAVEADKKIKVTCGEMGIFSQQKTVYTKYLQQYSQAVKTIVNNLSRYKLEQAYVKDYIDATLREAKKDFAAYRVRMVLRYTEQSDIVGFIDTSLDEFNKIDPSNKMDTLDNEHDSPGSSVSMGI